MAGSEKREGALRLDCENPKRRRCPFRPGQSGTFIPSAQSVDHLANFADHQTGESPVSINASGTEGYAEAAQSLISQWQNISFDELHSPVLHLLRTRPSRVLDVGAGIGTDAAALAAMGHKVVAVEPVDEFRAAGVKLHPSSRIEWLDDSLPDLAVVGAMTGKFDLAMLTAVWMHLDEEERRRAMPNVARLLCDGALLIMSLRHGPIPEGRRMVDVSPDETIQLANVHGLQPKLVVRSESVQPVNRRMKVTWTRLVFDKGCGAS